MGKKIRVRRGAKLFGPLTRDEVLELLSSGRLFGTDLASDGAGWVPLAELLQKPVRSAPSAASSTPSATKRRRKHKTTARAPEPAPPVQRPVEEPVPVEAVAPAAMEPPPVEIPPIQPAAVVHHQSAVASLPVTLIAVMVFAVVFAIFSVGGAFLILHLMLPQVPAQVTPVAVTPPAENADAPAEANAASNTPATSPPAVQAKVETVATTVEPEETTTPVAAPAEPTLADRLGSSVGVLCFAESSFLSPKVYVPHMTVWVAGKRSLVGRAVRLLPALSLLGEEEFSLLVVLPDQTLEVKSIHLHPDYPADRIGQKNPDPILEKLFLNDVAVIEVAEDIVAPALPIAENPGFDQIANDGNLMHYLSTLELSEEGEEVDFRPAPTLIPLTVSRHLLAPKGDPRFAAAQSEQFRLYHDGSPVIDSEGNVVGVLSLTHGPEGLIPQGPHQVLSVHRVQEILK